MTEGPALGGAFGLTARAGGYSGIAVVSFAVRITNIV